MDVYFQSRESEVNDGNVEDEFLMDFDLDSLEEDLPENQ